MSNGVETAGELARAPVWLRVRRLLGRVRRRFSVDVFDVYVRPVAPEHAAFEAPAGYRFAWATPAEIERCEPYHTELDERERRLGMRRLGFGHRAVIAFHGDVAVFTMWVNPRNINTPGGIKRRLRADQAFIYKAFTSPDHRGRGLYEAGMRLVLFDLQQRGARELLGYAHVGKSVSRKGLAALRFEIIGRYWSVCVPGLRHTFVSRALAARLPEALAPSRALADLERALRGDGDAPSAA